MPFEAFLSLRILPFPFIMSGGSSARSRRYSYVGASPLLCIGNAGVHASSASNPVREVSYSDPFKAITDTLLLFREANKPTGTFPFHGGFVGYLSYDLKHTVEQFDPRISDLGTPDIFLGFYDNIFVYDHLQKKGYLVSLNTADSGSRRRKFMAILEHSSVSDTRNLHPRVRKRADIRSNMTKEEYLEIIFKTKEHISKGEIYQANISQRLEIKWNGDPFNLYAWSIKNDPAIFSLFLDMGEFQIISNSPERFIKTGRGFIKTSPIKGTIRRGRSKREDIDLIDRLSHDEKERAEHLMIVDLERNDLGKICRTGSVSVREMMRIETLPVLHQMVSTVTGRLIQGTSPGDCLKATFPGGSVTGAPKIMAMRIIDELEPTPRGIYTGAIGFIDISGDIDMGIVIRTAIAKNGTVYLQVGGGIVSDSIPEKEYDETMLKASLLLYLMDKQL